MTPQFVDISEWQSSGIDWQKYKQWSSQWDGISRVGMRSSYGSGFKDKNFEANRAGALAAGIDAIVFYHYAYPQYNRAIDEANWQYRVVGGIRPLDRIILDFEEDVPEANSDWAYAWLSEQLGNYGKFPGIYASTYYIQQRLQDSNLAEYSLWLANWQFTPDERPACPPPWQLYEYLQYTDRATNIPGIPGTVDADIYLQGGTQPMPPTQNQINEALATWNMFFATIDKPAPPTGTGIYEAWLKAWTDGHIYGCPLTWEQNQKDWNGDPIIVQQFAGARCEWSQGSAKWYIPS